ncbi:hypothetical protein F4604DRAFT_226522 [Suillus subluteus]|nr:hypothetical protein F4604DRAFT_226522 [Suillus subluteus]
MENSSSLAATTTTYTHGIFSLSLKKLVFCLILWSLRTLIFVHHRVMSTNPCLIQISPADPRYSKSPNSPRIFDNVPCPVDAVLYITQSTALLGHLPTFLCRRPPPPPKPPTATKRDTQPRSRPLIWTRNLVSDMLRRRDQLREPPIVDVPCTAEELSRKKKEASGYSRPPNTYVIPTGTLQGTASSSQQPLATTMAPEGLPTAAATAVATGPSHFLISS